MGYSNSNPASRSRLGSTRALFSSSDDISPRARLSANSGTRSQLKSGRPNTACSAAVSSESVTGFGNGRQVMSWISLTDEIRAIRFLLDGDGAGNRSGPFNLTAPNAVTDSELTAALHAAFGKRDFRWLRVPEFALNLALGEMSSELLNSARVLPARLLADGFAFDYPDIAGALAAELPR